MEFSIGILVGIILTFICVSAFWRAGTEYAKSIKREPTHVIAVTDKESFFMGLYVDGKLVDADDTLYPSCVAKATEGMIITMSSITIDMPEGVEELPERFEDCFMWAVDQ